MSDLSAFYGPNAGYVLELYDRYLADPTSVDPETQAFFADFTPALPSTNGHGAAEAMISPAVAVRPAPAPDLRRVIGAAALGRDIREYGHLAARLDPLGSEPPGAAELDPATHDVTEEDLRALPASVVGGPAADGAVNAAQAIARLRTIYAGAAGYDFGHVHSADERAWLMEAVESGRFYTPLSDAAKRALLARLTDVETFERFLHQTYLGQKRFSIEGNDTLVPMLDEIIHGAAGSGTREVVIGMAHRGRLNVMAHVLGKPYAAIISAFEGGHRKQATAPTESADDGWTGDVKYHLGFSLTRGGQNGSVVEVPIVMPPNPSHLEAVDPVVEGMARASQDQRDQPGAPRQDFKGSLPILLHGDAAFPGQGVVAETLNLSGLAGYSTGGTIHIIVNNQIGYTTDWRDGRSTLYASDLAKGYEIPVVHVNADDPEACLMAARLAMAYRDRFHKDFLIDQIGYRRWGHNEGDEPSFTQPRMYAIISKHPTVRAQWADRLAREGIVSPDEAQRMVQAKLDELTAIRHSVTDGQTAAETDELHPLAKRREVETAISEDELQALQVGIHALPAGFRPVSKLVRQWERRAKLLDTPDAKLDWAHAEALAFAAILADAIPIRLSGQDAERGTFSQRHIVLHDAETGETFTPLQALPEAKASFAVYNSPLSEAAAVGFEYGYCVHGAPVLTLWEAQFGDFANGAQVMIDQFLTAARAKWRQEPALVLLLPHGYEGQGPEHSSGRLERYLQLSARDNIRVANCTTSAQYFHLLRRQAALLEIDPRPLVIMTPKALLRHPLAASPAGDLTAGTFQPVLDDPAASERREQVTRLVLCSGKVWVDLEANPARAEANGVAIVRVEQLAPFQRTALRTVIEQYPNLTELVWLQEEPQNMGAWIYMAPRLRELVEDRLPVRYIGRPERASPAEGSAERHAAEQQRITTEAFADVKPAPGSARSNGARRRSSTAVAEAPIRSRR